jgi:hypothetical protein
VVCSSSSGEDSSKRTPPKQSVSAFGLEVAASNGFVPTSTFFGECHMMAPSESRKPGWKGCGETPKRRDFETPKGDGHEPARIGRSLFIYPYNARGDRWSRRKERGRGK